MASWFAAEGPVILFTSPLEVNSVGVKFEPQATPTVAIFSRPARSLEDNTEHFSRGNSHDEDDGFPDLRAVLNQHRLDERKRFGQNSEFISDVCNQSKMKVLREGRENVFTQTSPKDNRSEVGQCVDATSETTRRDNIELFRNQAGRRINKTRGRNQKRRQDIRRGSLHFTRKQNNDHACFKGRYDGHATTAGRRKLRQQCRTPAPRFTRNREEVVVRRRNALDVNTDSRYRARRQPVIVDNNPSRDNTHTQQAQHDSESLAAPRRSRTPDVQFRRENPFFPAPLGATQCELIRLYVPFTADEEASFYGLVLTGMKTNQLPHEVTFYNLYRPLIFIWTNQFSKLVTQSRLFSESHPTLEKRIPAENRLVKDVRHLLTIAEGPPLSYRIWIANWTLWSNINRSSANRIWLSHNWAAQFPIFAEVVDAFAQARPEGHSKYRNVGGLGDLDTQIARAYPKAPEPQYDIQARVRAFEEDVVRQITSTSSDTSPLTTASGNDTFSTQATQTATSSTQTEMTITEMEDIALLWANDGQECVGIGDDNNLDDDVLLVDDLGESL